MAQRPEEQLKEVGSKLQTPPSSKDALLKLLKQAAGCLSELDQSPPPAVMESMQPFLDAIGKPEILKHQDKDVKLVAANCVCDIMRITAPEAPYSDDILKDIFHLIVSTFNGLSDTSSPSFGRRVVILETVAKYRSCIVMLDLQCDDLVTEMFSTFFAVARNDHAESVLSSMRTIMVVLLEESEEIREDLLLLVLSKLGRNGSGVSGAARRLAMSVIEHCAVKLEGDIKQFLISSMSGDSKLANREIDYHEVIYDIYGCAPQILSGVVPYLTGELLTDQLDTRIKAVKLVGDIFSFSGFSISEEFNPIFSEFLKRLTDRVVEVRMIVLEHVKHCLLSDSSRPEAPQILAALRDRLLDYDESIRKQVVAVICDVASHSLASVPVETIKLVAERLRDKALLVKKYTMERLAELFKVHCLSFKDGLVSDDGYDWIPGKILRCFYDKDFRSDSIESVLCGSLFPNDLSVKDKVQQWLRVFSEFDKNEVKALEKILEQKQRLQQEMQRYISLRQMQQMQEGDAPEIQKKVLFCFRLMSRAFSDPAKAEKHFQMLDQLKDANIWKILTNLLDPNTSVQHASALRGELLKILGEKHRLYDFLGTLSLKCSYLLFNKEHVKEIFMEVSAKRSGGNTQYMPSCMNLLAILASFSPSLFVGAEEELISLLKEDDETMIEAALHVLAKAGGTIREHLTVSSSAADLILERLCVEGSRKQAKYAVHALAAITKDDGLKSLSVLYKRLVDMLEEKTYLPAVLQCLGCIAQIAMPVFETRESEVVEFIEKKILRCNDAEDSKKLGWDDRSEICRLKIYGLKTLVKSYLPVYDAHLRGGIHSLLGMLRSILSFGEIKEGIESSSLAKAHLKLAAAKAILRLSRHWDDKIPIDVFHLTLRTPEIEFSQAKKLFLSKVHQYIKDRLLDGKYACSFLFDIAGAKLLKSEEERQYLADIIQMYQQTKARQITAQTDANSLTVYPEHMLFYLVHALAHQSCPNPDQCKDVKAYELTYRQLYLVLSLLLHKDEDMKSENNSNKEKECLSLVTSIFRSIKQSEDVVDATKTKTSYAICDLGLSIIKRLAPKDNDLQGLSSSVYMPSMLYKQYEKKESDGSLASEGQTWLADESALAHFESPSFQADIMVDMRITENHLKDTDNDGNELPLGKVMQNLKSQGAKSGKGKKKKVVPPEAEKSEHNVDILKMVREINLDNMGLSSKFEATNGHGSPSNKTKLDREDRRDKKRKAKDAASAVPKHQRSSFTHGASKLPKGASKAPHYASSEDSDEDISWKKKNRSPAKKGKFDNLESEFLASTSQKSKSLSSKHKSKDSGGSIRDEEYESRGSGEDVMEENSKLKQSDSASKMATGSTKKRKRRRISGLAKCSTQASGRSLDDIVGFRIKVWWPLDKRFYEGTVKSYDPIKNKHVILYDDGDVEVLRLEKERWELIESPHKKLSNSSKRSSQVKTTSGSKNKNMGVAQEAKKLITIVKGKRSPKKNVKRGQKGTFRVFLGEDDKEQSADMSTSKSAAAYDSEEEHGKIVDESTKYGEEPDKEVKSASETMQSPNDSAESDGKKSSSEERPGSMARDAHKVENEKEDHEDETESSKSAGGEGAKHEESGSVEEHGSEDTESEPDNKGSSDAEISDNETLSVWKKKVSKSSTKEKEEWGRH